MARKREKKPKKIRGEDELSLIGKAIFVIESSIDKFKKTAPVEKLLSREMAIIKARSGAEGGYARYALRMKIIRIFLCILLVLTVLLGVIFSMGRMNIDDIYYMAMDIGHMNSYSEQTSETLNYTKTQNKSDFALYKKGLAVASNSEITLFNATGRVTLTSGDVFSNPVIVTSNKYVLLYDLGGSKFSVYNSFKKLHSFTADGKISYASMCDGGGFCVSVKTGDYNSVVYMYDEDCNRLGSYSTNEYVISAEMSQNGKYTVLLSTSAQNGKMTSDVTVLKSGKDKVYSKFDTGGVTPYMCRVIDNDRIAVFCTDRVLVYSLKGNLKNEYIYPDLTLSNVSFGESSMAILFEEDLINGQNRLVVLNKNGKIAYEGQISGNFTDMEIYGDWVFLLTNKGICKFNYKTNSTVIKNGVDTYGRILVCDENRVLICTDSRGIYFNI